MKHITGIVCLAAGLAVPALGRPDSNPQPGSARGSLDGSANPRFTVVGLPDTQFYSRDFPGIFESQTRWVAQNQRRLNVQFVSHYGDLVQNGDSLTQFANADRAMRVLDNAGIRYGVVPGNHDVLPSGIGGQSYIPQNYLDHFGPQRFAGKNWDLGHSPSGMSSFHVFQGGGKDILSLNLDVDTPRQELEWAQGVLNNHRDKPVMITTHRYLQDAEDYTGGVPVVPSGRYPAIWYTVEDVYSPNGIQSEDFFRTFVQTNPNVFWVNAGHFHEEYRQTSTNLYGNAVHEVLADYQDDPNGGNGWLRLMTFDTSRNRVEVESYSPYLDQFRSADESRFGYDLDLDDYRTRSRSSVFQEGINGYGGTVDTWISEANRGASYGQQATIVVDDDVNNSIFSDREGQGLIRFDGIITPDGADGTIAAGAIVERAWLRITVAEDIDNPFVDLDFSVHRMLRAWDENSTWDSLGGGLDAGSDYEAAALGVFAGDNIVDIDGARLIDVTAAVQAWVDGATNFGFAILTEIIGGNDDGIAIHSSEAGFALLRPVLDVTWQPALIPAPASSLVLGALGLASLRRRR